ncbi:hypothetical protein [Paraglaciecola hydrolytica]|nr:hypothetical protein [Paraglaciecola hydrolytica]
MRAVKQAAKAFKDTDVAMMLTLWQTSQQKKIDSKMQELGYGTQ